MNQSRKKLSSADVARHARVSRTTVSYVLNGREDVSIPATTRDRVLSVARELGYQPNRAARALVTGRTQMIAFMASRLYTPSAGEVLYQLQRQVEPLCFNLTIVSSLTRFDPYSVDGILTFESPAEVGAFLDQHPGLTTPFVNMGAFHLWNVDYIEINLYDATRAAMAHLFAGGARRIAHVADNIPESLRDPRSRAYIECMDAANLPKEYVLVPDGGRAGAREAIQQYVRDHGRPDALLCRSDLLAIGAYRGLRDLGIRIPEDVALVGCNGVEETKYLDAPLTTIIQPFQEMCATGWQFLQNRMADPSLPQQRAILEPRLEIRESSRRPGVNRSEPT